MAQNIDDRARTVPSSPSVATPFGVAGLRGRITGVTRIGSRAGLIAIAAVAALVLAIFYGVSTSGSRPRDTSAQGAIPQILSTNAPLYANVPGAMNTATPITRPRAAQSLPRQTNLSTIAQPRSVQNAQSIPLLPQNANDNALQATSNVSDPRSNVPDPRALVGIAAMRAALPVAIATPNAAAVLKLQRQREATLLADQARRAGILVQTQTFANVANSTTGPAQTVAYGTNESLSGSSAGLRSNSETSIALRGDAGTGAALHGDSATGSGSGSVAGQTYEPNVYAQRAKSDFINAQKSTTTNDYLTAPRQASISPYEVQAGSVIPATLLTGINSDLPGTMIGQVSQNVYDSKTGGYLLIPAGARIVGRYDSQVSSGQRRVIVAWQRIIYPDASFIDINGMSGADTAGYSGLTGKVDDHSGKLFRNAILSSLIGAGATLLQPRMVAVLTPAGMIAQTTAASQVGGQIAAGVSQAAAQISNSGGQQQPTIEVRPGYLFNIMVDRDLVLPAPYGR